MPLTFPYRLREGIEGWAARSSAPRPTKLARKFRNDATDAQRKLWYHLRASQMSGFKFSRQMPVADYVADFLCRSARLAIELDGGQHDLQADEDEMRTRRIEAEGYRVIRFWNNDVNDSLDAVLARIIEALAESSEAHPRPLPHAGGELSAPGEQ